MVICFFKKSYRFLKKSVIIIKESRSLDYPNISSISYYPKKDFRKLHNIIECDKDFTAS